MITKTRRRKGKKRMTARARLTAAYKCAASLKTPHLAYLIRRLELEPEEHRRLP